MLPTEPIGSIPRPAALIDGVRGFAAGRVSQPELDALYESAVQDTIQRLEATGSPVITDGEQAKHSFATYSIYGLENTAPDGMPISFADGHIRTFPRLTAGPFRYKTPADESDRKSTRLNSSHGYISYAVFCLKKKKKTK